MKILYVIPSYLPAHHIGGPVKFTHDLAKALTKLGAEITVFTTTAGLENSSIPPNFKAKIDGVNIIYFKSGFPQRYNYAYGIRKMIADTVRDYDIVHIFSAFSYTTFIASSACRKCKVPYIFNPLGALDRAMIRLSNPLIKNIYISLIEKNNAENAVFIEAASEYESNKLRELGFKNRIEIIPPGLDISEYKKPERTYAIKGLPHEGKIILYLGRLAYKKGIEVLLDAFKRLVCRRDDVYLVIAGSINNYAKKIMRFVKAQKLDKKVVFTDLLLGDDKTAVFYRSNLFVLPSLGENFGISALEAMACGLPVILTKEVGLSTMVQDYGAGKVVKRDSADISAAIEEFIYNPALREAASFQARKLVQDNFNLDIIAGREYGLYKEILGNRK